MSGIIRESSPNASVDRRRKVSAMVPICTLRSMTPDLCFCLLADPGSVFYSGGATFGRSMAGAVNACGHAHMVFIFAPLGLALWPPRTENPRGVGPLARTEFLLLFTLAGKKNKKRSNGRTAWLHADSGQNA